MISTARAALGAVRFSRAVETGILGKSPVRLVSEMNARAALSASVAPSRDRNKWSIMSIAGAAATDVKYYDAECINPPAGTLASEWLAQGMPGAKC